MTTSDMKKILMDARASADGKSVWNMTLETFGMADGKHKRGDVLVDSVVEGLEALRAYVEDDRIAALMKPVTPILEAFNATQDELFTAFLKWAEKEDDNAAPTKRKINLSKACRRLDAYLGWMNDNQQDLTDEPLTAASVAEAGKIWDVQITYNNSKDDGCFLWWIDLGRLDKETMRTVSNRDHLRYIVWLSHLIMLDKHAQENGAMIVEDMGMIGFYKMATLVPPDLGAKMDRLTIGILPVKMKSIYIFGAARWMQLLMGLLKPFMSKKMRQRMVILPKKTNPQAFCEEKFTRQSIPKGFSSLEGDADGRALVASYQN